VEFTCEAVSNHGNLALNANFDCIKIRLNLLKIIVYYAKIGFSGIFDLVIFN